MRQERAIICFPFIGDVVGGSHISAIGLIQHLDRSRFEPLVVVNEVYGPLADLLRREGIEYEKGPLDESLDPAVSHRDGRTFAYLSRSIPKVVRFLRKKRVDIVHTNDGLTHVTWGVSARLAGAKLLWHHRGDPRSIGLRYIAPVIADRIVAVSRFAAPQARLKIARRNCSIVYSPFDTRRADGIDRVACRAKLLDELGCSPSTLLLGYCGSLIDRKRPLVFVEAIASLRRLAPYLEVQGILFGEALHGLDEAVRSCAKSLGLDDRVHLMGFRYPGEPWLAALDLLLVPAVDEPFGRTLIEAMLLGTPIVAAASGGNIEAIRDQETGVLVPPDQPDAFAKAVLELIADPTRPAAVASRAGLEARSKFGIAQHVDAISEIYEQLARAA